MPEIKLVVGLGNPGKEYEDTRHNIGFKAVDLLAEEGRAEWKNWSGLAVIAKPVQDTPVLLAKPMTYMNNSGLVVKQIGDYYRFSVQEILVVMDDFSLPLGSLRLRRRGSAGGHNGLCSIIEHLGSSDFARLRLGIGPVPPGRDPADFVLAKFGSAEKAVVEEMVKEAARTVEKVLSEGFEKTVSRMKSAPAGDE
ncbi:MAG: aminoacyl-tRNA hydrolase [Endomicrobiales bacterium]